MKVCWQCLATKSLALPLAEGGPHPKWLDTMWTVPPWDYEPSYASLLGFDLRQIVPDLLHVWNLGCARDLTASAIVYMVQDTDVFHGGNQLERLRDATSNLKAYARSQKLPLKLHKLSKSKLSWEKNKYPELKSSGYDSYVVMKWLQDLVCANYHKLPSTLCSTIWAADHFISILQNAGRYLTPLEQMNKEAVGMVYLKGYMALVRENLEARRRLYRLRPKYHILDHVIRSRPKSRLNVASC